MAFLDNSGDIILDAVLTDTGRKRLAQGDGSFNITKFAFGDDEIDYNSYNGQHSSGSAYYDLEILQTPVFEAFTNNTSMMKSKLISLTNNNLLYLPVLNLNNKNIFKPAPVGTTFLHSGSHVLVVDNTTNSTLGNLDDSVTVDQAGSGFIQGYGSPTQTSNQIRIDQGLDTDEVPATLELDPELRETQYIVEIDSRFASIRDVNTEGGPLANVSFIDDDLIATYYLTQNNGNYIKQSAKGTLDGDNGDGDTEAAQNNETILGPRGTNLRFGLRAATDVVSSNYLFTTLGTSIQDANNQTNSFIDTTIRVTGLTTGYRLDIPLRIVKLQ